MLPGAFLDLAERTGMIQDIDRWVVRQAIHLLAEHTEAGVRFEVNLSGKAFADPQLLPMIQTELADIRRRPGAADPRGDGDGGDRATSRRRCASCGR